MNLEEARDRIDKLKVLIEKYRYEYHVLDISSVSDAVSDSLKHELQELEYKFPSLITPDSPTQRVGGQPLKKFNKVTHTSRMISLVDIFSFEELQDWEVRNKKLEPNEIYDYWCEVKIDGFAVSLIYKNGVLQTAATRGDGFIGEDVTQNVKTIEAIPLKLNLDNITQEVIEVRGEIFMTKKEFDRANKEQAGLGEKVFANPRNLAAGSIRQLDSSIAASRKLDFFAYDLVTDLGIDKKEEEIKFLKNIGFKTIPFLKYCSDINNVQKFFETWMEKRNDQEFGIDGLVVKVNSRSLRNKLGIVGKAPRGMVAYKFPAEQVTTIVKEVEWNVGRTGVLTPLATFEPVNVAGSIVQHATLHNLDEINRLDIKIGDTVVIEKAGDIIPKVIQVLTELRPENAKTIKIPKVCPVCGSLVVKKEGEVGYYCSGDSCYSKEVESMKYFISALDILGLGEKIVEQLVDVGLLKSPSDLYKLTKEDLLPLDRFADKSAQKIIDSIQSKKEITLDKLIVSLGIRHVGNETAIDLAKTFKSIEVIKKASLDDLTSVANIGEVVAQSTYDYFRNEVRLKHLDDLLEHLRIIQPKKGTNILEGKSLVVTGSLERFSRDEIEDKIREAGGKVGSAVSKNTSYLIAGQEAGSKLAKAKELGVKILTENEFLSMINL